MKIDTAAAITGLPLCGGCHDTRSSINSPHRRVRSNFPPPEGDDAISPRSTLRPPRKSFAFALRTAAVPPGRCIGTRKCRNVKPLRFRDTALAALLRYLLQLRCCTPLPLCNTLFQRLSLLSDTSLVQSAFRQRLLAPFSTASRIVTVIAFFPF